MVGGSIVLDTSGYSHLLKGNQLVVERLANASKIYLSAIVLGELYFGFKNGDKESQNRKNLTKFLSKSTISVIDITSRTAEIYSDIKFKLKKDGKPIPMNDVWIASQSIETKSTLITFDKHFEHIPNLKIWKGSI